MKGSTAVWVSGAVCGKLWQWPIGDADVAGALVNLDARGPWGFWQHGDSFREALLSALMRHGGDFQDARFTADTVFRVERVYTTSSKVRMVRVWERAVGDLPDCGDLIAPESYVSDFIAQEG